MIYWKEECRVLATERAEIVVVDSYDERGVPVFAVRQVTKAIGTRSGRNSYWGVHFDEPLSDGCTAVGFSFVLAYSTDKRTEDKRLRGYHPAWTLTIDDEGRLVDRKYNALKAIDKTIDWQILNLNYMKTWRTIQKIAVAVGMTYGMWLGTNVDATDADSRNAFVIIVLSVIVAISLCMPDSGKEEMA